MLRPIAGLWLAAAATAAAAGDTMTLHFRGYAYDLDSGRYLYTEVHEQQVVEGEWISGSLRFYAPDGTPFGRKTLDFRRDPFLPEYRLDFGTGYTEALERRDGEIVMLRRRGERVATETVRAEGLLTADSGLLRVLRRHFAQLEAGETLRFRIVAPSRMGTYRFRARRVEDTLFEGMPAVRIQVEMDSMLNLLAGPLLFTFEPRQRRLLEFRGVTNVQDPATGDAYTVRTLYPDTPPADAPKNLPPLAP